MNGIERLWSTPEAHALAWALAHFVWQGALVALALAGALSLARKRSASFRYGLAVAALAALLVLPVLTAARQLAGRGPSPAAEPAPPAPATAIAPARDAGAGEPALPQELRGLVEPVLPGLAAFWLLGVTLLSAYHLGGWVQVRRLTRRDVRPAAAAWEDRLAGLRRRLGVETAVRLLESARVATPAVVGWLRPVILLPASALSGLTPEQLEAILAHELAHVRRHDYLVNLLQTAVETLLFYHPAVWWVSHQVRVERENCCDDLALAVCRDRLSYARALAGLESLRAPAPRLAPAAAGGSLLARIRRIVEPHAFSSSRQRSCLIGALAALFVFCGAAVHQALTAALPAAAGKERREWSAERRKDGTVSLVLEYRSADGRHRMGESFEVAAGDLRGLGPGPEVRFELRRDAGTFLCEGRFNGGGPGSRGAGTFTFQGDPAYVREMASLGYRVREADFLRLGLIDLTLAYARGMRQVGYGVPLADLIEMRGRGVQPAYVQALAELGYRDLPSDRLVEMRLHDVLPEYIRGLAALGYRNVPIDKMIEMRLHDVMPEYVRGLAELGYRQVPIDRLIEMRIHDVTAEWVRGLAAAGYRGIDPEKLVEMRIHDVSAAFIQDAESRGYKGLSVDGLIEPSGSAGVEAETSSSPEGTLR